MFKPPAGNTWSVGMLICTRSGPTSTDADDCSMAALRERFKASGGDIKELLVALTQTDAFLYRREGGAQ